MEVMGLVFWSRGRVGNTTHLACVTCMAQRGLPCPSGDRESDELWNLLLQGQAGIALLFRLNQHNQNPGCWLLYCNTRGLSMALKSILRKRWKLAEAVTGRGPPTIDIRQQIEI